MKGYLERFLLKRQVAFVCGGAGLLGSEISTALASAGARTVILDIERKKGAGLRRKLAKKGRKVYFEYFDSTDLAVTEEVLTRLVAKYEGLDIWVNAAYPKTADWVNRRAELKVESLRKNVDLHLNSYLWSSQVVAKLMQKCRKGGSIINLGSIYGLQGNDFTVYEGTRVGSPMAYAAIKGGIVNATRYLASKYGRFRIRVNTLCPGGIFDGQERQFVKNYEARVPLKRMGKPEDVASAALFLASDASSYITGNTFIVDGGWTIV